MNELTLRIAFTALALSYSVAGCALAGDRAGSGGNNCPTGETCSDLTPKGLFFVGTSSTDNIFGGGLPPTALGGRQTVTALTASGSGSPAYKGDFDAVTEDKSVLEILKVAPPSVEVRANALGSTLLRLLEPGTDKLLDRIDLSVQKPTKADLFPTELILVTELDASWAMLSGSKPSLFVRLTGTGETRIVDEDLTLTPSSGAVTREAWDRFIVEAPASGPSTFQIKSGAFSLAASATVVSAVDDIGFATVLGSGGEPLEVHQDSDTLVCFVARADKTAVVGAEWTFTLPPSVMQVEIELAPQQTSCIGLRGLSAGPAELTVEASGKSKTFAISVAAKTGAYVHPGTARPLPAPRFEKPTLGDRALLTDTL